MEAWNFFSTHSLCLQQAASSAAASFIFYFLSSSVLRWFGTRSIARRRRRVLHADLQVVLVHLALNPPIQPTLRTSVIAPRDLVLDLDAKGIHLRLVRVALPGRARA